MAACSFQSKPIIQGDKNLDVTAPFSPSPIQQLFFDTIKENHSYFNQSFSLRISESVEVEKLDAALHAVVVHHAMLRGAIPKGR